MTTFDDIDQVSSTMIPAARSLRAQQGSLNSVIHSLKGQMIQATLLFRAFHSDDDAKDCFGDMAAAVIALASDGLLFVSDAAASASTRTRPRLDPAARNCLVWTYVLPLDTRSFAQCYSVNDDGTVTWDEVEERKLVQSFAIDTLSRALNAPSLSHPRSVAGVMRHVAMQGHTVQLYDPSLIKLMEETLG